MTKREAVKYLKDIKDTFLYFPEHLIALDAAIEALKQPKPKKGKWIECNNLMGDKYMLDTNTFFRCSLCAHDVMRKTKYCSACGARMEGKE